MAFSQGPLTLTQALALLATATIGSLVHTRDALPTAHPVAFSLAAPRVLIHLPAEGSGFARVPGSVVAFALHHLSAPDTLDWSVVVTGVAEAQGGDRLWLDLAQSLLLGSPDPQRAHALS